MTERSMAQIMEKCRGIQGAAMAFQGGVFGHQPIKGLARQMKNPKGMGETTRFSTVKGEKGGTQLSDTT